MAIIKTAWTHDTFSYKGKYCLSPGASSSRTFIPLHEIRRAWTLAAHRGSALPAPLQNPIPVYSGFTHSLQTSLYWAKEGGKPIVMAGEMDFCELLWRRYREVAEENGRNVPRGEEAAWGGYLVLADTKSEAEAWAEDCMWMWDSWSVPFARTARHS